MRLYDTLSREVVEVVPEAVRSGARPFGMYVCGPTVQDAPHFGHARTALLSDLVRRYLEWTGVAVLHVRNITDIDDKIIARSVEEGRHSAAVAEQYTRVYEHEMDRLRALPPHIVPRATGHVMEMIELIEQLIERGAAYEAGGDVLFAVRAFEGYGKLSGRDLDEMRSGERVEPGEHKRDPLDFALWKGAKPDEPSWPSPWGPGRPGWHIECAAMAAKYLPDALDLHGGGLDLVFPHHENEIAQYEAATGKPLARLWLHGGMVMIADEKMSKSIGNIVSLEEALDRFGPDALRLALLRAHYRTPVDFSEERLAEAAAALDRLRRFVAAAAPAAGAHPDTAVLAEHVQAFRDAMDDDLGTPRAVAQLFDLVSEGNQALETGDLSKVVQLRATVVELGSVLGLELDAAAGGADAAPFVEALLELREEARARKDFATSDAIRAKLEAAGASVEDTPAGPRWSLRAPDAEHPVDPDGPEGEDVPLI